MQVKVSKIHFMTLINTCSECQKYMAQVSEIGCLRYTVWVWNVLFSVSQIHGLSLRNTLSMGNIGPLIQSLKSQKYLFWVLEFRPCVSGIMQFGSQGLSGWVPGLVVWASGIFGLGLRTGHLSPRNMLLESQNCHYWVLQTPCFSLGLIRFESQDSMVGVSETCCLSPQIHAVWVSELSGLSSGVVVWA